MFTVAAFYDPRIGQMFCVVDQNGREVGGTVTPDQNKVEMMCQEMNVRYGYSAQPQRMNAQLAVANPHLMNTNAYHNRGATVVSRPAMHQEPVNRYQPPTDGINPMANFSTRPAEKQNVAVSMPSEYIVIDGDTVDDDFNGSNPRYTKYIGDGLSVSPRYKFEGKLAVSHAGKLSTIFRNGKLEEMMQYDNHRVFIDEAIELMTKEERHVATRNFTINTIKEIETDSLYSCFSLMSAIVSRSDDPYTAIAAKCSWSRTLPFNVKEEDVKEDCVIYDNSLSGTVAALKKFGELHANTAKAYTKQYTQYINQCLSNRISGSSLEIDNIVEDYDELMEVISKTELNDLEKLIDKDNMKEAVKLKFEEITTTINAKDATFILPVEHRCATVVYFADLKIPFTTGRVTQVYERELASIIAATMVEVSDSAIGNSVIFASRDGWFSVFNPHSSDPCDMVLYVNEIHPFSN